MLIKLVSCKRMVGLAIVDEEKKTAEKESVNQREKNYRRGRIIKC